MRDDRSRLRDIDHAIDQILKETRVPRPAFAQDAKLQVWVLYHLQIIGEAARSLSVTFRERFPDPVWSNAIGLRNILVHQYFEIDEELIWQIVEQNLPPFKVMVQTAPREFEAQQR